MVGDMPKIVALLPMKANSQRVKGKNFRDFCGKPLFNWTLDTLLDVPEIAKVIINTDAQHELQVHGLKVNDRILVRDRKPDIRGDAVSMNLVLADDVQNVDADVYIMTHTTNPLMSSKTVKDALARFLDGYRLGTCDSLFTVDKVQSRFYRADCSPINHDPNNLIPTQDLEPWFEENSNLYIFTKESFASTNARIGQKPIMFETPPFESVDIDTPADWDFAVVATNYLIKKGIVKK